MKRYIKVNGQWIDTMEEQKQGNTYLIIDNMVTRIDRAGNETIIGAFISESDEPKESLPDTIYYLVVYLVDGCIDLKPFNSRNEAKEYMEKFRYDMRVDKMKILAKDTTTKWWKDSNGYWL